MFDVGFWEIAVISVIALIILGPERLPRAARSMGLWVGKARRMLAEVKRDIDRELDASELKNIKDEVKETVQDSKKIFDEANIKQDLNQAKSALQETATTLNEKIDTQPAASSETKASEVQAPSKTQKVEPVADQDTPAGPSKTVA